MWQDPGKEGCLHPSKKHGWFSCVVVGIITQRLLCGRALVRKAVCILVRNMVGSPV